VTRLAEGLGRTSGRLATPTGRRPSVAVATLLVVVAVAAGLSLLIGSTWATPAALLDSTRADHAVLLARIPRTQLALAVGGALGLAGALMQGLTRNPLADPGLLGVTSGAAFAMVLGMAWFGVVGLGDRIWLAFLGAAAAAVAVHAIAALGRDGATPVKLVIIGAALTAALSSWTSAVLLTHRDTMEVFRFWQVGTVGGREYDVLLTGLPFLVVGVVLALLSGPVLNTLALGDDLARGLGRRTARDRVVVGLAIVLLSGTATALAGPIAFVGLVVPHCVHGLVGPDHRRVLPLSLGYGAVLAVVADTAGRIVVPPTEVQVGIMTAVVGVPVFLWLIRRGRLGVL